MKNTITILKFSVLLLSVSTFAQITPENLIQLSKVAPKGITKDRKLIIYSVKKYSIADKKAVTKTYSMPLTGGSATEISNADDIVANDRISPNAEYSIVFKDVKMDKVFGKDFYSDLQNSDVMIYSDLNNRHWDTWEDGAFGHVFLHKQADKDNSNDIDINLNEPYDCPQKPFGGDEDCIWNPSGKQLVYVTKKKSGKEYALSTNTDIFSYDIDTKKTTNLTEGMMGYDMNPAFNKVGTMAFLSMKRDGYEADKNDIIIITPAGKINLTEKWDGTVESFKWSNDGKKIYFNAPVDGTLQLFEVSYDEKTKAPSGVKQITKGDFDVAALVAQSANTMIVGRTDMNHALEIYSVDLAKGTMTQLTHVNDTYYSGIKLCKVEKRYVTTSDNLQMLEWVIYPPDFDATKKYPTLLYCQGGPQSALTQFYSFRWNFQLMASNGYIVVAPNRRGMPGHGVKWNEDVSKDYGGKVMQDYLAAIDNFSKESFVDKNRLGCVGASFGGFSVYYLAGIHNKRFKTFIAHDGIFDWRSMYGNTEEMWFTNWDMNGPYWDKSNALTQKSYNEFNPINFVEKWDTPILVIQGGKDYRVTVEQGLGAFQAAQLRGIKSKLLYFPNENHWVLDPQNSLVWQREFYKWLSETLK